MAPDRSRRSRPKRAQPKGRLAAPSAAREADPGPAAALEEIQRVVDMPLAELMGTAEERAEVEELTRQAAATPAMARLRELMDIVGSARPATQAGNLKVQDAVSLARRLGAPGDVLEDVRSMDDLPEVARLFRWASAAGLVVRRGTRIVAGPYAGDMERDPLSAWLRIATTLLEHGPLDGFRRGWRKRYVELLDTDVAGLLVALEEAGGSVPLATIEERGWEQVADHYGYDPDDGDERRSVARLIGALVGELVELGAVARKRDDVVLTGLGSALAGIAVLASDD